MKICDDPTDPEKVKQTIAEVTAFVDGHVSSPFTMDEIKDMQRPAPKPVAKVIPKSSCEKRDGA